MPNVEMNEMTKLVERASGQWSVIRSNLRRRDDLKSLGAETIEVRRYEQRARYDFLFGTTFFLGEIIVLYGFESYRPSIFEFHF